MAFLKHLKKRSLDVTTQGFTMSELLVSVAITGTVIAIGTPTYLSQAKAGCQRRAEAVISQVLTQAQAYNDEFGEPPKGWNDLDKIATIMTIDGPANSTDFTKIILPGCNYEITGAADNNELNIQAMPKRGTNTKPLSETEESQAVNRGDEYNVIGCINYETGASDIRRGTGNEAASTESVRCT